jgi:hypothetical protein
MNDLCHLIISLTRLELTDRKLITLYFVSPVRVSGRRALFVTKHIHSSSAPVFASHMNPLNFSSSRRVSCSCLRLLLCRLHTLKNISGRAREILITTTCAYTGVVQSTARQSIPHKTPSSRAIHLVAYPVPAGTGRPVRTPEVCALSARVTVLCRSMNQYAGRDTPKNKQGSRTEQRESDTQVCRC